MNQNRASAAHAARADIDRLVDAFEEALWCDQPSSIEDCLQSVSEHGNRRQLLLELITIEYDHLAKSGRPPDVAEYQRRFPQHAADIAAHLQSPAASERCDHPDGQVAAVISLPCTLGRFQLLEEIGRGTFGTVYRALDTHLDRTVAVKIAHQSWLTDPESESRLIREARSTAQLHHPGIVPVFDAVRQSGRHLIVAEWVDGQTLAAAMSSQTFSLSAAAALVADIADALQYAHDHGVIHRDLKPANIMLDSAGQPRVMDFGLAKRSECDESITLDGQLLGTPAYMSPEQAAGEIRQIDQRSDIYSLGVILFELLTGELPFRGSQRMVLRQVIEDDPRLPRSLNDRVPIDLQTICATAMAKEQDRRYPRAAEFAEDLRRWLRGEPIQARPIGRLGKAWRWARRNPIIAALAATVLVLLIGVSAVSTMAAIRISQVAEREKQAAADALAAKEAALAAQQRERQARIDAESDRNRALEAQTKARRQEENANQISEFVIGILKAADPLGISGGPARSQVIPSDELVSIELLKSIGQRIDAELADQPKVRARLLIELADVHRSRGNLQTAEELIQTANQIWLTGGSDDRGPARLHFVQARVAHDLGHYDQADQLYRSAIDWHERTVGRNHLSTATVLFHHGWLLADKRAADGHRSPDPHIEAIFREVLQIRRDQLGDAHRDTAVAMTGLLAILVGDGREEEAKDLLVPAMQVYQSQPGGARFGMAVSLFLTGNLARGKGRLDKAISDYEKAIEMAGEVLGNRHPLLGAALIELAGTYKQAQRYGEAEAAVLESLDIIRSVSKHGHPRMIPALVELADWRFEHQEFAACEQLDLEALRIWQHFRPCGYEMNVCNALLRRGYLCYAQGNFLAAAEYYQQAIELTRANGNMGDFGVSADFGLAQIDRVAGELVLSIRRYEGYSIWLGQLFSDDGSPTDHALYSATLGLSGYAGALIDRAGGLLPQVALDEETAALLSRLLAEALDYQRTAIRPGPILVGEVFFEAARWELIQGSAAQAGEYARQALETLKQRLPEDSWIIAAARVVLAACLIEAQQLDEAQSLLLPAAATLAKSLGDEHQRTVECRALLERLPPATAN